MSCSDRKKLHHDDLIVGNTYRVINEWYAYNYMNSCTEIYTGEYIRKIQINNNIIKASIMIEFF
jgi:hypothetical protein